MEPKDIFIEYQRAKANFDKRGFRIPKNWDKVMARKDWSYFEALARKSKDQLRLVDIQKFFMANFDLRHGKFHPAQFMQLNSFVNYDRFLKQPKKDSTDKQVRKSMQYIVNHLKTKKITIDDYFKDNSVYPDFLVHFIQGNLHRWILIYYCRKINNILNFLPEDIVQFNLNKSKIELEDQMEIWWFQLLNSSSYELAKEFFNALHNR